MFDLRRSFAQWLLWCCLLVAAMPLAAWTLVDVDDVPAAVAARLPLTTDYQAGRDQRRYYELRANGLGGEGRESLVLERDRGQRLWIFDESGHLIQELPLGAAPFPARAGMRGALVPLDPALSVREIRYLIIDSVLGVQPRPRIEDPAQFYERESSVWTVEVGLVASLLMLIVLSLAFSLILREPGYLAYVGFLILMLIAISLRHPYAFRMTASLGMTPERIAASGVLASTIAALAAVTLLRAASGIGSRYPRASRSMQWFAMIGIVLGVVDVVAIQNHFTLAQWAFDGINLMFGINAMLSAWLLAGTALGGGRSARLFLVGWSPMVVVGAWFSLGSLVGLPQTQDPHRWVMFACVLQGIGWAVALGDRALSLQRERDSAWALAELDPLTGLPNRRMLDRELTEARSGWLLVCDLDEFKAVNDRYGHAVGDRCLIHFAQCMREALAGAAVFGRYGGEEFLAIVPGGDSEQARSLAERLRERTASTPVHVDADRHRLTVSIGVAALDTVDARVAMALADRAMYQAKAEGRNRVALA